MTTPVLKSRKLLSAGIIPVKLTGELPRYLLLRAFTYWDFPKGHVEEDEDPFDAAQRELQEETGLRNARFLWGKDFRETIIYAGGKVARYYLAEVLDSPIIFGVNPVLKRAEHHEFRWCTSEEVRGLIAARVLPIFEWAHQKILQK